MDNIILSAAARLLFLLTLTVSASALNAAESNSNYFDFIEKNFQIKKPQGDGPFPAIIFVSGCSGYKWTDIAWKHYNTIADKFVAKGYAVMMYDFYASRPNKSSCMDVDAREVVQEVMLTAKYLKTLAYIKQNEINLHGWSFGGIITLQTVNQDVSKDIFKKAIAYYPMCSKKQKWQSHVPILIQSGSLDDVTPFMNCRTLIDNSPDASKVKFRVIPGGRHAFDFVGYPEKKPYVIGTIGYNEKAAKKAWRNVERFMFRR